MTMTLLIDIGNSRIKWCQLIQGELQSMVAMDYRQPDFNAKLQASWSTLPAPDNILLASVGQPERLESVIHQSKILWPAADIQTAKTTAEKCGVKNAYRSPEKLGVDRWLALIAAHHLYAADCWIVDCGSAITLDFIRRNGQHQGGLIAPGIALMQKSLSDNTANLSQAEETFVTGLADFTEAAIYSGTLLAASGLIEKAVNSYNSAQIILTGGDASLIAQHLQIDISIEPKLVLKGLALYSQHKC